MMDDVGLNGDNDCSIGRSNDGGTKAIESRMGMHDGQLQTS